jgi:hypothetical protein
MTAFSITEKLFVITIGQSLFNKPYHIQQASPLIKTSNIGIDTSSAFFASTIFTSCGNIEMPDRIPATMPIIVS